MTGMISPSRIALEAMGRKPSGSRHAEKECRCGVCGDLIREGDLVDLMSALPGSFSNWPDLADASALLRCGFCTAVMTEKGFLANAATGIFTLDGAFPVLRKEDRAWALTYPHDGPFVMAIQASRSQHTIWRAPVSLPGGLIFVRVGDEVLKIRRAALTAAVDVTRQLNERAPDVVKPGRPKKSPAEIPNPFVMEWNYQDTGRRVLKYGITKRAEQAGIDLAPLHALSNAEVWALGPALYPEPKRPERLVIKSEVSR